MLNLFCPFQDAFDSEKVQEDGAKPKDSAKPANTAKQDLRQFRQKSIKRNDTNSESFT